MPEKRELGPDIPNPITTCDGCGEKLSTLQPYLKIPIKASQDVILSRDGVSDEPHMIGENEFYLGTRNGRGRILTIHDFGCLGEYAEKRIGQTVKLEAHHEDEIYVPKDNREPEELVEEGELPPEILALHSALAEQVEGSES